MFFLKHDFVLGMLSRKACDFAQIFEHKWCLKIFELTNI